MGIAVVAQIIGYITAIVLATAGMIGWAERRFVRKETYEERMKAGAEKIDMNGVAREGLRDDLEADIADIRGTLAEHGEKIGRIDGKLDTLIALAERRGS